MAKHKRVGAHSRPASDGTVTDAQAASAALGLVPDVRRPARVREIPLADIVPDPVQPRRGMPAMLRDLWVARTHDIRVLLDDWLALANDEATQRDRVELYPARLLRGEDPGEEDSGPAPGPYEETLRKLLLDAATVYEHGLEQPITVVRLAEAWQLQSGERRTLMHWSLVHWLRDEAFSEIPAIEVEQFDVWRQAAENNAREDLTAIERARQLALLLMASYPEETFQPYHELPGQTFYQQALGLRMPYGRSGDFLAAMGLKTRSQLSHHRRLLELPVEVWQLADEHRWSEGKLREMRQGATLPDGDVDAQVLIRLARIEAGLETPRAPAKSELLPIGNNSQPGQGKPAAQTRSTGDDTPPPVGHGGLTAEPHSETTLHGAAHQIAPPADIGDWEPESYPTPSPDEPPSAPGHLEILPDTDESDDADVPALTGQELRQVAEALQAVIGAAHTLSSLAPEHLDGLPPATLDGLTDLLVRAGHAMTGSADQRGQPVPGLVDRVEALLDHIDVLLYGEE